MNENDKNFQYIEDFDVEFLNSSFEFKETIISLNNYSIRLDRRERLEID